MCVHQVWLLKSECCGRGVPMKVVCAECMKTCCLGAKNSVVKGLIHLGRGYIVPPYYWPNEIEGCSITVV